MAWNLKVDGSLGLVEGATKVGHFKDPNIAGSFAQVAEAIGSLRMEVS